MGSIAFEVEMDVWAVWRVWGFWFHMTHREASFWVAAGPSGGPCRGANREASPVSPCLTSPKPDLRLLLATRILRSSLLDWTAHLSPLHACASMCKPAAVHGNEPVANVSDSSSSSNILRWITDYHNPRLSPLRLPLQRPLSPRPRRRKLHTIPKLRNHQYKYLSRIPSTRATRSCPLRISTPDATATVGLQHRLRWGHSTKELGVHSHKHQV